MTTHAVLRQQQPTAGRTPPRLAVVVSGALRRFFLRCADRMLPAHLAVLEQAHGFSHAYILSTMVELGIPDALRDGPLSADELATRTGTDAGSLHRLLRAAAVFRAVRFTGDGRFEGTRFTTVLGADHPSAAADWCRYIGSAAHQAAWGDLTESVRTGADAFRRVHGQKMFEWFATHPDESHHFSSGLGGLTRAEAPAIVSGYPFPTTGTICDVGGGQGVLLAAILAARPGLRGIIVDHPTVLDQARTFLQEQGLADRVELVPGDLMASVVAHADLYLLKWVLHDWDDATGERIVRTVARSMPPGARLLVIEGDLPHNAVDPRFSMIDLQMLVVTDGGRERTSDQLGRLVTAAGLGATTVHRTTTGLVMLEARATS
ncbi:MAG TPA: methyltransferase [Actinomycetes bacterium]|nr:methyltransferase [Actinomycetes bacterium]